MNKTTTGYRDGFFWLVHEDEIEHLAERIGISSTAYCDVQNEVIRILAHGQRAHGNFTVTGSVARLVRVIREDLKKKEQ